jgi:hypothetical protein
MYLNFLRVIWVQIRISNSVIDGWMIQFIRV